MPLPIGLLACNLTAHYTHGTSKVYLFSAKNIIHCLILQKLSAHPNQLLLINCLTICWLNFRTGFIVLLVKNKQYEEIA